MKKANLKDLKIEYAKALVTGNNTKAAELEQRIIDNTAFWVQPTKDGAQLCAPGKGIGLTGCFLRTT